MGGEEARLRVVESEAEVRWAWECGRPSVTRDALRARLRARLLPDVVLASELEVRLALTNVMTELAGTEAWLAVVLERGGRAWADVVLAMQETLAEAHRMTWHASLTRALGGRLATDPRGRTVAAAGRALDAALGRAGLLDPAAEESRLAAAIARADPDEVAGAIGAHGLSAASVAAWRPAELSLWRALDARLSLVAGRATVELATFDRPLDAEREPDPLGRLVDAVAEALDSAPETRPIAPVLGDFSGGEPSRARVELRRGDTARSEARAVADAVLAALRAGAAPDRIAVVTPDDSPVREALRRVLTDAGVPVAVEVDSGQSGLVQCALESLAVAGRRAPRLAVAALLRSPYVDAGRVTGLSAPMEARSTAGALARVLERTRGVSGQRPSESLARTVLASREGDAETRERLSAIARRVGEVLERAASGANRAEHAAHARELFVALGLSAVLGAGAAARLAGDAETSSRSEALRSAELAAFARDDRGKRALFDALEAYEAAAHRLPSPRPLSFEAFRVELAHAIRGPAASPGLEARSIGAVRLAPLGSLASRPLALLVIADLHAGALSGSQPRATLLDPAVRAALTESIEPSLRPSVSCSTDADRVRLASAADAAAKVLVSTTTRDDDGTLRPPHPLVAWLERHGVEVSVWRDEVVATQPLTDVEAHLRDVWLDRSVAGEAAERAAIEWRRERAFGLGARPGEEAPPAAVASPAFQAVVTEETGGGTRPMSVTALDRFGACRFQGFATQVLGARRKIVLPEVIGPREEGTLLHGALAAAFDATRDLWSARPRPAEAIRAAAQRAASAFLGRERATSRQLRASLDEIADRAAGVVEWSLADPDWDFVRAEASFGRRGDAWGPVVIDDGRTRATLAGSIDRIDVAHAGNALRVLDYKRSEDGARRVTDALGEASFQLPVYARAASHALDLPPVGGAYVPTRLLTPSYRTRGGDAAFARAVADDDGRPRFERRATEILGAVRSGDAPPRPFVPDTCRWCDQDGACRKPRFVIEGALADEWEDSRAGTS